MVLNNTYIADSENEFDAFYSSTHKDIQLKIEESWDKIFDCERYSQGWTTPPNQKSIQATLWEIRLDQVKKVEHFIAK